MPRFRAPILCAATAFVLAAAGCSQESTSAVYPAADLRPPALLAAGPTDARSVTVRFDEEVNPVKGSFAVEPRVDLGFLARDQDLIVTFASDQSPGVDYALTGEVDDAHGNRTRFLLKFAGWNERPPRMRISEVQTGKNGSKTKPHRDFIELEVLADGNVGGEEISWASSVKSATYRFPGIEVRKGGYIVLHLAPEGLPEEIDELGDDLSASGGADASTTGRDLWCPAMPLPDESGVISISQRPGDPPFDGLFYAAEGKAGALPEGKLATSLSSLASAGVWPISGENPAWEDGFRWKSSTARSICRSGPGNGPESWYVSAAGGQSPGASNTAPEADSASKALGGLGKKSFKRASAKGR
jgi:hypothetical protein